MDVVANAIEFVCDHDHQEEWTKGKDDDGINWIHGREKKKTLKKSCRR